jgi:hypothetical protein
MIASEQPLNALVHLAGMHARQVLVDLGQDLMPSWLLVDKAGKCTIVGTPWRSDQDKQRVRKLMREHMRKHGTVCYSVVVEAWAAHAPPDFNPAKDELQPWEKPLQRPDRWEIVIAIASDGKQTQSKQWKIIRDWSQSGKIITLEPVVMDAGIEGWMTEMLSSQTRT